MTKYSFSATFNYPDGDECDSPDFTNLNALELEKKLNEACFVEKDWSSILITIVRKED